MRSSATHPGRRRRIVAALVLAGLAVAAGWGLWIIRPVLAPFLLAVAFSYVVAPLVGALTARRMSRGWAIIVVYAVLGLLGSLVVIKLVPQVIAEIRRLSESIPMYSLHLREAVDGLQQRVYDMGLHPDIHDHFTRLITDVEIRSVQALQNLLDFQTLREAARFLLSLVVAPFLAFYLLRDIEYFKERFVQSLPVRYRQDILQLLRGLDRVLAGFVRGQILLALTVGSMAAFASALLGLRFALLLGIWAGMTEFIPYVGPVLGAVPAVLAGLATSPWVGLETLLAYALIQQIENAVLSPKIMGESVGLHPLVVMMVVLTGGFVAGGWGLILALPTAGLLRVLWIFAVARLTAVPVPALRPEGEGQ